MFKIVLKRIGRKKVSCYKIVARNSNKKQKNLYLGYYNKNKFKIKKKIAIEIKKKGGIFSRKLKKILKNEI